MMFSRKIKVTFIDDVSGQVLGVTKLPPDRLPESFLLSTTMHLGDQDWSVVSAAPKTRDEFCASRRLVLRLRRVEQIDPATIRYSLPTIAAALPPESTSADGKATELHEDDWRQIELVHGAQRGAVAQELEAVRRIYDEHAESAGFNAIHLRAAIVLPLAEGPPSVDALPAIALAEARPLRFQGHDRRVADGSGYESPEGWVLYWRHRAGVLATLGVVRGRGAPPELLLTALHAAAAAHDLLLVDWCRCVVAEPTRHEFHEALTGSA